MKAFKIKGWIFAKPNYDNNDVIFEFSQYDYEEWAKLGTEADWSKYRKVCEHIITGEAPDMDPKALALAGLEAKKTAVRAELGRRIAEIEDEISKLLALPYSGTGTSSPAAGAYDITDVSISDEIPF